MKHEEHRDLDIKRMTYLLLLHLNDSALGLNLVHRQPTLNLERGLILIQCLNHNNRAGVNQEDGMYNREKHLLQHILLGHAERLKMRHMERQFLRTIGLRGIGHVSGLSQLNVQERSVPEKLSEHNVGKKTENPRTRSNESLSR